MKPHREKGSSRDNRCPECGSARRARAVVCDRCANEIDHERSTRA